MPEQRRTATQSWTRVQDTGPQPRPVPQRRPGETLGKVSQAAEITGNLADAGKALPEFLAEVAPSETNRGLVRGVGRGFGAFSAAAGMVKAKAGYEADLQRGMAKDEAWVKNYADLGLTVGGGLLGAGLFATATGPAAPAGAFLGGALGAKIGSNAAKGVLQLYLYTKDGLKLTTEGARQLLKNMEAVKKFQLPVIPELTDKYYIDRLNYRRGVGGRGY